MEKMIPAKKTDRISSTFDGGQESAGIGTGDEPDYNLNGIFIHGGNIYAQGGNEGAGIGGGSESRGSDITISGGTIHATGGKDGAGIGEDYGVTSATGDGVVEITGGGMITIPTEKEIHAMMEEIKKNPNAFKPAANIIFRYKKPCQRPKEYGVPHFLRYTVSYTNYCLTGPAQAKAPVFNYLSKPAFC